jgi:hypothetical protein
LWRSDGFGAAAVHEHDFVLPIRLVTESIDSRKQPANMSQESPVHHSFIGSFSRLSIVDGKPNDFDVVGFLSPW